MLFRGLTADASVPPRVQHLARGQADAATEYDHARFIIRRMDSARGFVIGTFGEEAEPRAKEVELSARTMLRRSVLDVVGLIDAVAEDSIAVSRPRKGVYLAPTLTLDGRAFSIEWVNDEDCDLSDAILTVEDATPAAQEKAETTLN